MVVLYNSGEPQVYERATGIVIDSNLSFVNQVGEVITTNLPYKIVVENEKKAG
jgi:hypothetical protein